VVGRAATAGILTPGEREVTPALIFDSNELKSGTPVDKATEGKAALSPESSELRPDASIGSAVTAGSILPVGIVIPALTSDSIELRLGILANGPDGRPALSSDSSDPSSDAPVGNAVMADTLFPDGIVMPALISDSSELKLGTLVSGIDGRAALNSEISDPSSNVPVGNAVMAGKLFPEGIGIPALISESSELTSRTLVDRPDDRTALSSEINEPSSDGNAVIAVTLFVAGIVTPALISDRTELKSGITDDRPDGKAVPICERSELRSETPVGRAVTRGKLSPDGTEVIPAFISDSSELIAGTTADKTPDGESPTTLIPVGRAALIPESSELSSGTSLGNAVTTGKLIPAGIDVTPALISESRELMAEIPDGKSLIAEMPDGIPALTPESRELSAGMPLVGTAVGTPLMTVFDGRAAPIFESKELSAEMPDTGRTDGKPLMEASEGRAAPMSESRELSAEIPDAGRPVGNPLMVEIPDGRVTLSSESRELSAERPDVGRTGGALSIADTPDGIAAPISESMELSAGSPDVGRVVGTPLMGETPEGSAAPISESTELSAAMSDVGRTVGTPLMSDATDGRSELISASSELRAGTPAVGRTVGTPLIPDTPEGKIELISASSELRAGISVLGRTVGKALMPDASDGKIALISASNELRAETPVVGIVGTPLTPDAADGTFALISERSKLKAGMAVVGKIDGRAALVSESRELIAGTPVVGKAEGRPLTPDEPDGKTALICESKELMAGTPVTGLPDGKPLMPEISDGNAALISEITESRPETTLESAVGRAGEGVIPALRSESSELIAETPVGKTAPEGRPVMLTPSSDNNELSAEGSADEGSPVGSDKSEGTETLTGNEAPTEMPTDSETVRSEGSGRSEATDTLSGNEAAPDGTEKPPVVGKETSGSCERSVGKVTLNGSETSRVDEISEASEMSEAGVPEASEISEARLDGMDISAGIDAPEGREVMLLTWPGTSTRIVVMALGSNEFGFGRV